MPYWKTLCQRSLCLWIILRHVPSQHKYPLWLWWDNFVIEQVSATLHNSICLICVMDSWIAISENNIKIDFITLASYKNIVTCRAVLHGKHTHYIFPSVSVEWWLCFCSLVLLGGGHAESEQRSQHLIHRQLGQTIKNTCEGSFEHMITKITKGIMGMFSWGKRDCITMSFSFLLLPTCF